MKNLQEYDLEIENKLEEITENIENINILYIRGVSKEDNKIDCSGIDFYNQESLAQMLLSRAKESKELKDVIITVAKHLKKKRWMF